MTKAERKDWHSLKRYIWYGAPSKEGKAAQASAVRKTVAKLPPDELAEFAELEAQKADAFLQEWTRVYANPLRGRRHQPHRPIQEFISAMRRVGALAALIGNRHSQAPGINTRMQKVVARSKEARLARPPLHMVRMARELFGLRRGLGRIIRKGVQRLRRKP